MSDVEVDALLSAGGHRRGNWRQPMPAAPPRPGGYMNTGVGLSSRGGNRPRRELIEEATEQLPVPRPMGIHGDAPGEYGAGVSEGPSRYGREAPPTANPAYFMAVGPPKPNILPEDRDAEPIEVPHRKPIPVSYAHQPMHRRGRGQRSPSPQSVKFQDDEASKPTPVQQGLPVQQRLNGPRHPRVDAAKREYDRPLPKDEKPYSTPPAIQPSLQYVEQREEIPFAPPPPRGQQLQPTVQPSSKTEYVDWAGMPSSHASPQHGEQPAHVGGEDPGLGRRLTVEEYNAGLKIAEAYKTHYTNQHLAQRKLVPDPVLIPEEDEPVGVRGPRPPLEKDEILAREASKRALDPSNRSLVLAQPYFLSKNDAKNMEDVKDNERSTTRAKDSDPVDRDALYRERARQIAYEVDRERKMATEEKLLDELQAEMEYRRAAAIAQAEEIRADRERKKMEQAKRNAPGVDDNEPEWAKDTMSFWKAEDPLSRSNSEDGKEDRKAVQRKRIGLDTPKELYNKIESGSEKKHPRDSLKSMHSMNSMAAITSLLKDQRRSSTTAMPTSPRTNMIRAMDERGEDEFDMLAGSPKPRAGSRSSSGNAIDGSTKDIHDEVREHNGARSDGGASTLPPPDGMVHRTTSFESLFSRDGEMYVRNREESSATRVRRKYDKDSQESRVGKDGVVYVLTKKKLNEIEEDETEDSDFWPDDPRERAECEERRRKRHDTRKKKKKEKEKKKTLDMVRKEKITEWVAELLEAKDIRRKREYVRTWKQWADVQRLQRKHIMAQQQLEEGGTLFSAQVNERRTAWQKMKQKIINEEDASDDDESIDLDGELVGHINKKDVFSCNIEEHKNMEVALDDANDDNIALRRRVEQLEENLAMAQVDDDPAGMIPSRDNDEMTEELIALRAEKAKLQGKNTVLQDQLLRANEHITTRIQEREMHAREQERVLHEKILESERAKWLQEKAEMEREAQKRDYELGVLRLEVEDLRDFRSNDAREKKLSDKLQRLQKEYAALQKSYVVVQETADQKSRDVVELRSRLSQLRDLEKYVTRNKENHDNDEFLKELNRKARLAKRLDQLPQEYQEEILLTKEEKRLKDAQADRGSQRFATGIKERLKKKDRSMADPDKNWDDNALNIEDGKVTLKKRDSNENSEKTEALREVVEKDMKGRTFYREPSKKLWNQLIDIEVNDRATKGFLKP